MSDYKFYEYCDCGGEYQGIAGGTFDSMPSSHPVKCKKCGSESRAHIYSEAMYMNWKNNRNPKLEMTFGDLEKLWIKEAQEKIEKLEAQNKKLIECVEFYAEESNWDFEARLKRFNSCTGYIYDEGDIARQCLKEIKGNEHGN